MDVSALKIFKVKMGVCKRVMKELKSYEQEVEREFAKTENMKTSQACPLDIKQQVHLLAESYMIIPNCQKRLETALATLEKTVIECEAVTTPDECEELLADKSLQRDPGVNQSNHSIIARTLVIDKASLQRT